MESESSLVGTESGVELNAEATVHLALALVVLPGDAELDDSLGDGGDLEGLAVFRVLLEEGAVLDRGGEFLVGLEKEAEVSLGLEIHEQESSYLLELRLRNVRHRCC